MKETKTWKKIVKWLCWHFWSLIMDLSGFKGDSYLFLKLIHLQIRISLELDISDICLRINKLLVSKTRNCSSFWNSFYSCLLKLLVPELKVSRSQWYIEVSKLKKLGSIFFVISYHYTNTYPIVSLKLIFYDP